MSTVRRWRQPERWDKKHGNEAVACPAKNTASAWNRSETWARGRGMSFKNYRQYLKQATRKSGAKGVNLYMRRCQQYADGDNLRGGIRNMGTRPWHALQKIPPVPGTDQKHGHVGVACPLKTTASTLNKPREKAVRKESRILVPSIPRFSSSKT